MPSMTDVADDGVERLLADELQGGRRVGHHLAGVPLGGEEAAQRVAHLRVVVHDQEARLARLHVGTT